MSTRRHRFLRTFIPIAIAASIPLGTIWILGPIIRDAAELRMEVQRTNSLIETPPQDYADDKPVLAGIETTLRTLHSYDFPNQRDTSADESAWGETVRNNLEWADIKRFQIVRIDLGDALSSLTSEPDEWSWLFPPLRAERVGTLQCKLPPFVELAPVGQVLDEAPWKGVVTGDVVRESPADDAITVHAGFSTYFGPKNEFIAGFNWERSPRNELHLDVRGVGDVPPGAVRNLIFLLTMQHRPDAVLTHLSSNEHAYAWIMNANSQDSRNWYTYLRARAGERPLANVFFDAPRLEANSPLTHFRRHFLATVLSGIGMAGYDVSITTTEPVQDATLHVILTEDGALSPRAQALVDAGGSVLWMPVTGMGIDGRTTQSTQAFGINPGIELAEPGPSPDGIKADDTLVFWQTQNRQDSNPSHVQLEPDAVEGEVLVASDSASLIIRKENRAIINGAALHPDASAYIARTIATLTGRKSTVIAPFEGYGTTGTRNAFLATGATELRLELHHDDGTPFEEGTPIRIVRFNGYGNPRGREVIDYEAPFSQIMTANELIIIEALPEPS